jgi:hypothetical protein
MNMTKHMKSMLMAAVLSLTAGGVAAEAPGPQQKLALLPMSGTNVHAGYLDAGRDIMKDHLLATGRFQVIAPVGESGSTELSGDQAVAKGKEVGAELAVVTHLTRLSGTGRVRLIAYRVSDGFIAHADSISISGGPDDLDPALKRLAVGLATGKPASQTADIESVTQKDADPLLKQEATRIFGLRLAMLLPLNRPGNLDPEAYPGIGIFWMYDARTFIGEVALDLHFDNDNDDDGSGGGGGGFAVGIGGYYPFNRNNFTPYVGGSLSYAFVNDFGGAGANGIRVMPTFGFLFGRLSTVQIRGELGYFFNTFGERAETAVNGAQIASQPASKSYAHGPHFGLGLGF